MISNSIDRYQDNSEVIEGLCTIQLNSTIEILSLIYRDIKLSNIVLLTLGTGQKGHSYLFIVVNLYMHT